MQLIDTHAHIYLADFDTDRELLVTSASKIGISTILMPAIDSTTHNQMLQIEEDFKNCISMMGLHPCSVKANFTDELALIENWFLKRKFIAVGEIGLDLYWDKTFLKEQVEVFHRQIEIALKYEVPIVVHSRNATEECIEVVKQYPSVKGVFHCFSGTIEQAETLIGLGFFLGIGGVVTFKNAGLDKVVEKLGLEYLILETDAPYLAPVPFRGKRNEPAYLELVAQKLSLITGKDLAEVAAITSQNAINLFNLS